MHFSERPSTYRTLRQRGVSLVVPRDPTERRYRELEGMGIATQIILQGSYNEYGLADPITGVDLSWLETMPDGSPYGQRRLVGPFLTHNT